jgi:hypothetical protein
MPGEIITARTLEEGREQLRKIYKSKNNSFEKITKQQYEDFPHDERPDSDNHLNEERLEKDESEVIDLAFYKYLPDRKIAYRILLKNKNHEEMEDFFMVVPEMA